MFVVVVYDVNVKRVNRVCSYLRQWLYWRQNSFFEGELSDSEFFELKKGLKEIICENEDSIYIYIYPSRKNVKLEVMGIDKGSPENVL